MSSQLKHNKSLGMLEVFSIAAGAMISSGLFVLPAVIFAEIGYGVVITYLLAGAMMIPSLLAKAELATAMPKSGGTYFFVERSLGSLLGSFAGFAGWFSIALKGSFALVGIGAFWTLINPSTSPITYKFIALGFVVVFTLINLTGVHGSAKSQVIMVGALILILAAYIIAGGIRSAPMEIKRFIPESFRDILPLTGMVFISFGGLTKVAAVAHEVKNPGKTLPYGMILSFTIVIVIYVLAITVTVNLLDAEAFRHTLMPLSEGAAVIVGQPGAILLAVAALIAFATTANAAILSASQNPAAMSRDGLLPAWSGKIDSRGVPVPAILITGCFMALVILILDLPDLVKVASTMKLILFLLVNLSLILMRESRIVSYRPLFKAPLYPILPITGILISALLIYSMGSLPLMLSAGFFVVTTIWTIIYRRGSPKRDSALFRIVERIVAQELRSSRLADELTDILIERDGVSTDRFDRLIRKAIILDVSEHLTCKELFEKLATAFSLRLKTDYNEILEKLIIRDAQSTTQVSDHLAIPHIVLDDEESFEIVLVRASQGVTFENGQSEPTIVFALAGSMAERNFHLQCLMAIAQIARSADFINKWNAAFDEEELRLLVLLAERSR